MTNTKTESCDEEKARPLDGALCNVKEIEEVLQYARSADYFDALGGLDGSHLERCRFCRAL